MNIKSDGGGIFSRSNSRDSLVLDNDDRISQLIESNSECEEIFARSEVTERDHVIKSVGPKEHTDLPMNRRSGISERLESTEHPLDPRNERDGAPFEREARMLHDDDRAQDKLGRRNPEDNGLPTVEMQSQPRLWSGKRVLSQVADHNIADVPMVHQDERAPEELVGMNPVEKRHMSSRAWSKLGVDKDQTLDGLGSIQPHHESDNGACLEDARPGEFEDHRLKMVPTQVRANPESLIGPSHGTLSGVSARTGLQANSGADFTGSTQLVIPQRKETSGTLGLTGRAAMLTQNAHTSSSSGELSGVQSEQRVVPWDVSEVLKINPVNQHSQENSSRETWQAGGVSKPSTQQEMNLTHGEQIVSVIISEEPTLQRGTELDRSPLYGQPQESQNIQGKRGVATSELDQQQAWMGTAGSIDKPNTRPLQAHQGDRRPDAISKEDGPRETRPEMIDKPRSESGISENRIGSRVASHNSDPIAS